MKKIFALFVAGLAAATLLAPAISRAASAESVTNFTATAILSQSGSLAVDETVVYNFGNNDHHGIYRVIPNEYHSDNGQRYRLKVSVGAATMDGRSVESHTSTSSAAATLKLGDPDVTISGVHTYHLQYTLAPIVSHGDGGDILKYNITGNGWEVPIEHASVTLNLGRIVPRTPAVCYTGSAGATAQSCTADAQGSVIRVVAAHILGPAEGLSTFVDLPADSVASYLEPYVPPRPSPLLFALPVILYLAILICAVRLIAKLLRARRLRKDQTIVAQYEPPAGLTPMELGLLNDDRAGLVEITATLIDLAVRGHLKITQTQPKKLFSKAAYQFDRLKSDDPLRPHESKLLKALFSGTQQRKLSEVDKAAMQKAVTTITADTGQALTKRGFYKRSPGLWRVIVPIILLLAAFMILGASNIFLIMPGDSWILAPYLMMCTMAAGFTALAAYFIHQPAGLTPEGAKVWAEVHGLKLYLTVAEKDRLNFSDAPAKTPELFNKLLPAAVALGVEKQWAKQFEGIDVMSGSGWYGGYPGSGYTAALFASSLSSDFSSGIQQNFTTTSSGGSSSDGFSGGGFGGGGGGSW